MMSRGLRGRVDEGRACDRGRAAEERVSDMRASAEALARMTGPMADWPALSANVATAADTVEAGTAWLLAQNGAERQAAAGNGLETFCVGLGAWAMGDAARHAARRLGSGQTGPHLEGKPAIAAFYMANVLPMAAALHSVVTGGAASVLNLKPSVFGAVA